MSWLVSLFSRAPKEPTPRKNARLYQIGGMWGNAVNWSEFPKQVVGWKNHKPTNGDILTCEMVSGKTAVWIFEKVDLCDRPPDMFFATVSFAGYLDEITFSLPCENTN